MSLPISSLAKPWPLFGLALALFVLASAGGAWLYWRLTGGLAQLDGAANLHGLTAPVTIERDALGVPTLRAANRLDIARAIGFVHGQERFFQMDLLRRSAAGELAELFGAAALPKDKELRIHRFRWRAERALGLLAPAERDQIDAYAAGVNAGLAALRAPPFEYLLLRAHPVPWRATDSALVIYAMYLDLQDSTGQIDTFYGLLHDFLPEPLYAFLTPAGGEWDAPLVGDPYVQPPLPDADTFNLRWQTEPLMKTMARSEPTAIAGEGMDGIGSNNWAVAGSHTAHGGALLANDMHLGLRIPNIWYRAAFVYPGADGAERRVVGVTLPGVPAIVAGSNGSIAWGFTNSYGDWTDVVLLDMTPDGQYQTPNGGRAFQRAVETIRVKGGEAETLEVSETQWGPEIAKDTLGRRRTLRWVAHDPEAVNMVLVQLEDARNVEEALGIASRAGAPAQNFVVADSAGHIGWTISGPMPRRRAFDGRLPQSWADGAKGWDGWLAPEEHPRIVDPPNGRIWTANNRTLDGAALAQLGVGYYQPGARARQIRDDLLALERAAEADMLAIQIDDRALFLQRWRDLLLETLTPQALSADPRRRDLQGFVVNWGARAAVDSVGYTVVRAFRRAVLEKIAEPINALLRRADKNADYTTSRQIEGPAWALVTARPQHLLNPRYDSWPALLLAAADAVIAQYTANSTRLADHTWGSQNTSAIRHPLSPFIPIIGRWLDMPSVPLPGDAYMPRVQSPAQGASERMAVAPGHEEQGYFHMPGGQSGHPLSPFYRAGHDAWVKGEPTPFLPGKIEYSLVLMPAAQ